MDIFNVFRGLKKSNSESKLGDRLGFGRKSKNFSKTIQASPLPPRPGKVSSRQGSVTRIIENIPDDTIANGVSLHSPRRDTDQFGNAYEPLVIKGNINTSYPPTLTCKDNICSDLMTFPLQTRIPAAAWARVPRVAWPMTRAGGGCWWTGAGRCATRACSPRRRGRHVSRAPAPPAP